MKIKRAPSIARFIEIANYIFFIPGTIAVIVFTRGLFRVSNPPLKDLFVFPIPIIVFYLLGMILHIGYYRLARHTSLFISFPFFWWLSIIYNLSLALYFFFYGSLAAIVFFWPLFITFLSFVALINEYQQPSDQHQAQ